MPPKRSGSRRLKAKPSTTNSDITHDHSHDSVTRLAASASSPLPPATEALTHSGLGPEVHKSVSARPDLLGDDKQARDTDMWQAGEPFNTSEVLTSGPSASTVVRAASKRSAPAASTAKSANSKPTAPAAALQVDDPHPLTATISQDKDSITARDTAPGTTTPHDTTCRTMASSAVKQETRAEEKGSSGSQGSTEETRLDKDPATEPITDSTTYFAIPAPPQVTEASAEPSAADTPNWLKDAHAVAAQPPSQAQGTAPDTQDVSADTQDIPPHTRDTAQVKEEPNVEGNSTIMQKAKPPDSTSASLTGDEAPAGAGAGLSDSRRQQAPSASPAVPAIAADAGSHSSSCGRAAFAGDATHASINDSSTDDMLMGTRSAPHAAAPADTAGTRVLGSESQKGIIQQPSGSEQMIQASDMGSSSIEKQLELDHQGGGDPVTGPASDTDTTLLSNPKESACKVVDVPTKSASSHEVNSHGSEVPVEPNTPATPLSTSPVDTAGLAAASAAAVPYTAEVAQESAALIAAIAAAGSSIKTFPAHLLPVVGTSPGLTPAHMEVLSVWYSKFCSDTEAQQQAAMKQRCSPHMRFEGNFIKVTDQHMVGVQFYALKRVIHDVELLPEKVELLPASGKSDTTYTLRVVSRITFTVGNPRRYPLLLLMFPMLLLVPDKITTWVTDELTVRTQDNALLVYKQQVHNIPTAPAAVRWLLGLVSSWLLIYFLNW